MAKYMEKHFHRQAEDPFVHKFVPLSPMQKPDNLLCYSYSMVIMAEEWHGRQSIWGIKPLYTCPKGLQLFA